MFLREFHFEDTQKVWDGIFANYHDQEQKAEFETVEYICLAMFVFVKEYRKKFFLYDNIHSLEVN